MHDAHARSALAGKTHEASLRESKQGLELWSITFNSRQAHERLRYGGASGLVLSLSALLFASVTSPSNHTLSAQPARSVFRDDFPREENYGPQSQPPDLQQFREDRDTPPIPQEVPQSPDRPRSREFDRMSPRRAPHHRPEPRRGHEEDSLPEHELIQRKLTVRYGNPAVVHLLRSLSTEQGFQLFAEVSILIDSRHLKPSTYDARVKQAAKNLIEGLDNRAFLRANGLEGDPSRTAAFRTDVEQLANSHPISGRDEAYQALRWTMRAAEEHARSAPVSYRSRICVRLHRLAR